MPADPGSVVVVVAGGDPIPASARALLPPAATVVAADSGLDIAAGLGVDVDLIVGDLDSVSPERLRRAEAAGVRVERHPAAKDSTDLAIALDVAVRLDPARVLVIGGHGGRLDHFLANALLLAAPAYADLEIEAHMGPARVRVIRTEARLAGEPGELVSLLPAHGGARGVTTEGLLYPLRGEDLPAGATRGVSNEFATTEARVTVDEGTLLAVMPGALGTHLLALQESTDPNGEHDTS